MSEFLPLPDRKTAGRLLARALEHLHAENPIVLALPRGGVPVAFEIARALDADLDLLMVRKLGAPGHPEYAIGAVVDGSDPQIVLNDDVIGMLRPGDHYIEEEVARQFEELERRRRAYLGSRPKPHLAGRTVIIVDDGIATGATIMAALKGARKAGLKKLVLAVPVAPPDTVRKLSALCDDIIVLATPEPFYAVGQHYRDFGQVEDSEVISMLEAAKLRPHV